MNSVLYWLARAFIACVQMLPLKFVARLGRAGGALAFHLDARHRRVTLQNLTMCFAKEKSAAEIRAIAQENFRRIGENYLSAIKTAELRQRIASLNSTAAIIECIHQPLYFEDVFTGERKGLDLLTGKKVASLSGIAQPESFEQSLVQVGGELVYSKRFADHHRFTQQEILNAINRAKKRQAEIIVTTQKDAVRFPKIDRRDVPFYFMRIEIKIVAGANDFQDCVRKICFR